MDLRLVRWLALRVSIIVPIVLQPWDALLILAIGMIWIGLRTLLGLDGRTRAPFSRLREKVPRRSRGG